MRNLKKISIAVSCVLLAGGIITAGTGLYLASNNYDEMVSQQLFGKLDSSIRVEFSKDEMDSSFFVRKGMLRFFEEDELLHSFKTSSTILPFFIRSTLTPDSDELKKFFKDTRIADPVVSLSPFKLSLYLGPDGDRTVSVPVGLGESCVLDKGQLLAYVDNPLKNSGSTISPEDVNVDISADTVLCQRENSKDSIFFEKVSMKSALPYFFDEDGLAFPYFASMQIGSVRFQIGKGDFTLKNIGLNHMPTVIDQEEIEKLYLNFYVGGQGSASSVTLQGFNDSLWKQEMRDGAKRGEYALSLEGPMFNNKNNQIMSDLVGDGYLRVDGKQLKSDLLFKVDLKKQRIEHFELTANGKKADLTGLLMMGAISGVGGQLPTGGIPSLPKQGSANQSSNAPAPKIIEPSEPMAVVSDSTKK